MHKQSFKGLGIKVDYFATDVWFWGVQSSLNHLQFEQKSGEEGSTWAAEISLRTGYQWQFHKNLYLQPWVSVGYQQNLDSQSTLKLPPLAVFPTVHIGWEF